MNRVALIVGGVIAIAGVAIESVDSAREFGTPTATVRTWLATMQRGDVALLRSSDRLGMRSWADALVEQLGEEDYRRVVGLYVAAETNGRVIADRLLEAVRAAGESAFSQLPVDDQQRIEQASHLDWVFEHGWDASRGVADWRLLRPGANVVALQRQLGDARLSADDRGLLSGRATDDPAVQADSMLAQIAARRDAEGQSALDAVRQATRRQGEREFNRLPWSVQSQINHASRATEVLQRGLAALPSADRARIPGLDALREPAAQEAWRVRLGVESLEPSQRAEIDGRSRAQFERERSAYVASTGPRLARAFLIREFAHASLRTERVVARGSFARDFLQRHLAEVDVVARGFSAAVRRRPHRFALEWVPASREWRVATVHWAERESPSTESPYEDRHAIDDRDDGGAP